LPWSCWGRGCCSGTTRPGVWPPLYRLSHRCWWSGLPLLCHRKLDDGVGAVPGHAVMSEQGLQAGTEHAPLRVPRVEDQRGGCVVTYPYSLRGGPSGSPGSSCRGRRLVPGFLA
jgi:hypothetical protein